MSETQTTIDFRRPAASPVVPRRRPSLEHRFMRFVGENPGTLRAIIWLSRHRKAEGHGWWSMRACFEDLRERPELIQGDEAVPGVGRVVLNNDFTPLMARLVMEICPDLAGFFNTR